jgi:ribosomal protein S18 acetylase RimI-like enzyme
VPAQQVLEQAKEFFGPRDRGFILFVRSDQDQDLDALCKQTGLPCLAQMPCMLIHEPLRLADLPDNIRMESFKEEQHVRHAISVNSKAYQALGITPKIVEKLYGNLSRLLSSDNATGHVLYKGNKPVSTGLTIFSGSGAGIYWVGTIPEAQRAGLGTVCTRIATNAGFQNGASMVTLQASPNGEPVYLRLGYKTYDRLKWYAHPKQS